MSDTTSETPPPKKGKKGLILMVAVALCVLGGGGAAAWYFLKPKPDAGAEQAAAKPKKSRTFATLEPFTVNLSDPGGERFVQLSLVLETVDASAANSVTANVPAIRNALLLLLSTKSSQELLSVDGKIQLAGQIAAAAGAQLGWTAPEAGMALKTSSDTKPTADGKSAGKGAADKAKARPPAAPNPVEAVHFVQFIVQ